VKANGTALWADFLDVFSSQAQDIILELSRLPSLWKPWEPPLEASYFLSKLKEARRLCNTARVEYAKIKKLENEYPAELSDMPCSHNDGQRLMVVLSQLAQGAPKGLLVDALTHQTRDEGETYSNR
jgi:hypothetical protein